MTESVVRKLTIAPSVTLPIDAALARFVVLGKSGSGKSNANVVMAEELVRSGVPTWQLDPLGNLWGQRSSLDGESAGLPIVIFGGSHGDAPLGDARKLCQIVAGERISALMDISELEWDEQRKFAERFCTELLRVARQTNLIGHLFLDEADRFAPNAVGPNPVKAFARTARNMSIGWTFSTQRPQILAPDVIESANVIVAMKIPTGLAQDSIGRKVAGAFDSKAETKAMLDSLPRLRKGDAWFIPDSDWLHGQEDAQPFRFHFRWRDTFDSTAPRQIGMETREPKVLADIDLEKIREVLEETPEPEDQSEEIAQLRGRIDDLEVQQRDVDRLVRQMDVALNGPDGAADQASLCDIVAQIEQLARDQALVFDDGDRKSLEIATAAFEDVSRTLAGLPRQIESLLRHYANGETRLGTMQEKFDEATALQSRLTEAPRVEIPAETERSFSIVEGVRQTTPPRPSSNGATSALSRAERLILTVLVQYPRGRTAVQIAILTGYAVNGGGFRNALGSLNTKGYIARGNNITISATGLKALGHFEPLPTGRALLQYWIGQLSKAESLSLKAIADVYPRRITVEDVARIAGYEAKGGGFRNALGKLRTLQLIEGRGELRASDALFERSAAR